MVAPKAMIIMIVPITLPPKRIRYKSSNTMVKSIQKMPNKMCALCIAFPPFCSNPWILLSFEKSLSIYKRKNEQNWTGFSEKFLFFPFFVWMHKPEQWFLVMLLLLFCTFNNRPSQTKGLQGRLFFYREVRRGTMAMQFILRQSKLPSIMGQNDKLSMLS